MPHSLSVQKTVFSKPKAAKLLKLNTYESQRPIRRKRVRELVKKLNDGRFHAANIAVARRIDGTEVLMNGQHQLSAIFESGIKAQGTLQTYTLSGTNGEQAKELALIWSQFDEGGMRNQADIAFPFARAAGLSISRLFASKISSALAAVEWGYGRSRNEKTKDERASLFEKYKPEVNFVVEHLFKSKNNRDRWLQRVFVLTVAIKTFQKNRKDAVEFWGQVQAGELLKKTDPTFKLREYLMTCHIQRRYSKQAIQGSSWAEIEHKIIHAWNAFRKGETLSVLRYSATAKNNPKLI